jgi:uncharacterized membrane protein YjjP (DUF1212 family)
MKTPKLYYGALIVFCALTFSIGMAGATGINQNATKGIWHPGFDLANATQQQQVIDHLEQEGVDVSEVKTALQNGDSASVKTWLDVYFKANKPQMTRGTGHPGFDLTNVTQQQKIISGLEQKGVDVSEVKTALQNGDSASVKTWLNSYFKNNKPQMTRSTDHTGFDLTNATQQQKIISRLEQKGVDVTELKSDFQSGNTSAAKAWLENYAQTHKTERSENAKQFSGTLKKQHATNQSATRQGQ